tara:strand:+ start:376 stop:609 length:234 start_codon:yes stop_codon:yes gene_type:complete
MKFPQYRRYKNKLSYFRINSLEDFEEFKLNGKKVEHYHIQAKILPDRNYIQDLLSADEAYWEIIDLKEFNDFIESAT